jgi:hypothetical protein
VSVDLQRLINDSVDLIMRSRVSDARKQESLEHLAVFVCAHAEIVLSNARRTIDAMRKLDGR